MPRVLITVSGKKPQPYRLPLDRELTTLGRASDNDIVIDDSSISSHHCEMVRVPGGVALKDLGSTNGMKLDGEWMSAIDLVPDIDIKIGDVVFEAEFTDEELEELGKEDHEPQQKVLLAESAESADDSDEEEEVVLPETKPKKAKKKVVYEDEDDDEPVRKSSKASPVVVQKEGLGVGGMFFLLLLAALAFFIGLTIRHFIETGQMLPTQMFG